MSVEIPASDAVVSAVTGQVEGVTAEQVAAVMSAWQVFVGGDPAGTVRRSAEGSVAHRVLVDNVPLWQCSDASGSVWRDMTPSLPWPVVFTPEAS